MARRIGDTMTAFMKQLLEVGKRGAVALLAGGAIGLSLLGTSTKAEAYDCNSADPAQWPPPAKPYFMIAFDTSGSMATAIATNNSCAYPNNRLGHGRCAVKNTLLAFSGLAHFGLASYARVQTGCAAGCFTNCTYANVSGNSAGAGCTNGCGPEPGANADSSTRAGALIRVPMRTDLTAPSVDNTASLISWVDNNCTGSTELFADGCTPMNGILRDMYKYYSNQWVPPTPTPGGATLPSPLTTVAAGEKACRSVNVILVTDGQETCDTLANAVDAAGDLFAGFTKDGINWKVKVSVIDFGDAGNEADQIAAAGGTGTAKHATNEEELSAALADIIGGAIAPEVCDNTDNNCNNCVDEGYTHYCNINQTCCAWANAAQRNTCLTNYQATISPADPDGDLTLLPCTTVAQSQVSSTWLCYDPKETCDNIDNNCASGVDNGVVKCGNPSHCPEAEICNGQDDDCDGLTDEAGVCSGCIPSPEVCDGCDNDCDGMADDGVPSVPCGLASPANCAGTLTCKPAVAVPIGGCAPGGGYNPCNNMPQAEVCDGADNDCDGLVDDGIGATPCEPVGTPPGLNYGANSQCKMGTKPCNGTCTGWVGPSAEICDNIDNDCDGQVDEGIVGLGLPCGTNTGECSTGLTACVSGAIICQGGVGPQPEQCNGLDDDCDGTNDDAPLTDAPAVGNTGCWNLPGNCCSHDGYQWCPPPGATCNGTGGLTSPCATGVLTCAGALGWTCTNPKGPAAEVCDNVDNDCDGTVDDGVPQVGQMCGPSIGACSPGVYQCTGGVLDCVGDVGPVQETCDNIDNDCDGTVDNNVIGVGVSCGNNTPPCTPGLTACVNGAVVCQGGTGPQPESCDGVDNDCDTQIDEAPLTDAPAVGSTGCWNVPGNCCSHDGFTWCPPPGATCNGNGALPLPCNAGTLACQSGGWICQGSVGPAAEICDSTDNDCDGQVDDVTAIPCDPPGAGPGTVYGAPSQCVKGTQSCGTCAGAVGPTQEVCDGIDNDCDGTVDENAIGVGVACGNSNPPCTPGTTACVNGAIACQGGVQPQQESCDGIDNDCDLQVDEGALTDAPMPGQTGCWSLPGNCCTHDNYQWCPPPGATCNGNGALPAPCGVGNLACQGGGWTCQAAKPPGAEICDGIDNNCNGSVDDVTPTQCDPPGTGPGTVFGGASQCVKGTKTCGVCNGAIGPSQEICDGIDNDCDGTIDESVVGAGTPCGNSTPPCSPGTTACVGGSLVCQGGVGPQSEQCDGLDNNCNGVIDDAPLSDAPAVGQGGCWNEPGNCCTFDNLTWCPPPGATCNDNGGLFSPCAKGALACQAGAWVCQNPQGPAGEVCDGVDNDCNGQLDDVTPTQCDPSGAGPGTVYGGASQCVKGTKTCGACAGAIGPTPEICDGIDNDCDGSTDEGIVGLGTACGINQPPCTPGTTACVNGMITCQGGVGPQPEQCDGIDNDCDGQADDAPLSDAPAVGQNGCWTEVGNCCTFENLTWCPPPGATCNDNGTLLAPCNKGVLSCAGAAGWVCQSPKPPAAEACDGLDNNCDGTIDEGNFPGEGVVCGQDTGLCQTGTIQCVGGTLDCVGDIGPTQETCDNLDNDCDGVIDNGSLGGGPCPTPYDKNAYPGPRDKGKCIPGNLECQNGLLVCVGGVGPSPEECNGIDDDCDGTTDELGAPPDGINGTANPFPPPVANIGDMCGSDVGVCSPGAYQCLNGIFACVGGVTATPEECDCNDNNCDGATDNQDPNGPPLCAPGKSCVKGSAGQCQCAAPCGPDENPCPFGQVCDVVTDSETGMTLGKYCTTDFDLICGDCKTKTGMGPNNTVICAPDGTPPDANCVAPPVCTCRGPNGCKNPCFNVTCDAGKVCTDYGPKAGTCVLNNCFNAPCLGCGKICHNAVCTDNPCTPNSCPSNQVCKPKSDLSGFDCVDSCAAVNCPSGQTCVNGACVATCDPACVNGQVCDMTQNPPKCIDNQCPPGACPNGAYCDPVTGDCKDYPCEGVLCPSGQACQDGECVTDSGTGGSGGGSSTSSSSSGSTSTSGSTSSSTSGMPGTGGGGAGGGPDKGVWGLATGGGGCFCDVGPGALKNRGTEALVALALALSAARLRRRSGNAASKQNREVAR